MTTTTSNNASPYANPVMKSSLVTMIMIIMLSLFSVNVKSNTIYKPVYDSLTCLEIEGKILNQGTNPAATYTVELVHNNGQIDTLLVNGKNKFKFALDKDAYYVIRISMTGYISKMVSVNTEILVETDGLYRFMFETSLLKEEALVHLNKDVTDMPIAIIYFDNDSNNFVYSKKYTDHLKKEMRKGRSLSNNGSTITTGTKVLANAYSK